MTRNKGINTIVDVHNAVVKRGRTMPRHNHRPLRPKSNPSGTDPIPTYLGACNLMHQKYKTIAKKTG